MPAGYIVSNESSFLASNTAIQSTPVIILSGESGYLDSNIGIQSTPAVYPLLFTVSSTEIQTWID